MGRTAEGMGPGDTVWDNAGSTEICMAWQSCRLRASHDPSGTWLDCSAGMRFGPPGNRKLIYFVDDMSLPLVDKYDTQSAVELLRQSIDYHGW